MFKTPSDKALPRQVDPRRFAQQGINIDGYVPAAEMPRLIEATLDSAAKVQVELSFAVNEEKKKVVTGRACGELTLVCQRCLDPVQLPVEANVSLAIVWDEEGADALPSYLDPWIHGEGLADLYEMIEEEMLLSLPAVAYHNETCIEASLLSAGKPVEVQVKKNPFNVLEQLKSSPKS
ncbi:MAG: DUF177 domain-containing protein [Cellvibrio sp.]|nr:DUF177 domain-containing protein [Cellvibrio sp.]